MMVYGGDPERMRDYSTTEKKREIERKSANMCSERAIGRGCVCWWMASFKKM